MKIKHLPYHLGILIPCALIVLNGASTYYSSIKFESDFKQKSFGIAYLTVWLTYVLAIFTPPGFTDGFIDPNGKYVQCTKCNRPKPERAHHCKTCGRCVLRMDHHCPWTENCVGFRNLPHFVRFLSAAVALNAYGVFKSAAFLIYVIEHRRYLSYFIPNKSRIWIAVLALIGDLFVLLTLVVLWLRIVIDTMNGKTQIENWEVERVETLARRKLAPLIEFPFDVDIFSNVRAAFGEVWEWPLPFCSPSGTGHAFPRLVETEYRWPPAEREEVNKHEFYRVDRWTSFEGEGLSDFGVDMSVSDTNRATASATGKDMLLNNTGKAARTSESEPIKSSSPNSNSSSGNDDDTPLADIRSRLNSEII